MKLANHTTRDLFFTGKEGQCESIYADRDAASDGEVSQCGDYERLRGLPLLSPAGEVFLFRKMNRRLFRAEELSLRITQSRKAATEDVEERDAVLCDAIAVRNHIAECNLRLVMSIARKFSTLTCYFDDLMSEGSEIILKAIGTFDCSRGFRFSTYATHSIRRHFYRYTQRQIKRNTLEHKPSLELLNEIPNAESDPVIAQWVHEEQRMTSLISKMAARLSEREHRIVVGRFGLSGAGIVKTLRELSIELGLSKERVRQLQIVAIGKLGDLFDELDPKLAAV
jgi:RNA polymerase primary sigma factor